MKFDETLKNLIKCCAHGAQLRVDTPEQLTKARHFAISIGRQDIEFRVAPWTVTDSLALQEQTVEDIRCGRL